LETRRAVYEVHVDTTILFNTSLKTELQKVVESLYIKHVPEDTRQFIERKNKPAAGAKVKSKRSARAEPAATSKDDSPTTPSPDAEEVQ